MTATEHALTRTVHRAFPGLTNKVTYACSCTTFTVTDTGDEAKRAWLRHLLSAEVVA
jgi:hypothetical protein